MEQESENYFNKLKKTVEKRYSEREIRRIKDEIKNLNLLLGRKSQTFIKDSKFWKKHKIYSLLIISIGVIIIIFSLSFLVVGGRHQSYYI
ncbi:MAG: hypothetical protein IH934_00125 [Nanoarchaeota archaeon]|nr:hypothetical protein [Nanoarchaeota archaeon]